MLGRSPLKLFCSEVARSLLSFQLNGRRNRSTTPNYAGKIKGSKRTATSRKRKNLTTDAARKAYLQADKWARDVQPRSVTCKACCKTISLDKRKGAFYAGLWCKHRNLCRAIKRLQGKALEVSAKLSDYQSHLFKFNYNAPKEGQGHRCRQGPLAVLGCCGFMLRRGVAAS
jgi:hypothetical protein